MTTNASANKETLFFDAPSYFDSMLTDIKHAKSTVDLEMYIFKNDSLGVKFADTLIDASKRGVKARILVDSVGSPLWGDKLTKRLEEAGIQTRVFHPLPWRFWQWSRSVVHASFISKALYLLQKINSRNHRKVCIIDNKTAYVGSQNIDKCHLTPELGGDGWRDTAVRIKDHHIKHLSDAYETAWQHKPVHERIREIFKHINTNPVFRLNNTRHRRRILYRNLLRRISQCKKRIWMTNAYFVPDNKLLRKLKDAAQRGIDVRILLPQKSDIFFIPWAATTFYRSLLNKGVKIFEYTPSILHAKTLILDDWMLVGSSNLNHRSLFHDLEVDVNIRLPESKNALVEQFKTDLTTTHEIFLKNLKKGPLYQRFICRIALYLKVLI